MIRQECQSQTLHLVLMVLHYPPMVRLCSSQQQAIDIFGQFRRQRFEIRVHSQKYLLEVRHNSSVRRAFLMDWKLTPMDSFMVEVLKITASFNTTLQLVLFRHSCETHDSHGRIHWQSDLTGTFTSQKINCGWVLAFREALINESSHTSCSGPNYQMAVPRFSKVVQGEIQRRAE